ncbi:hypothetical protein Tco_1109814 [Tanacetum coccineum]|uniref:Reverse transcriptase domain-containing protein n=1 Tax=Tanacetum coccineum TaxID=301880 RepID=A0ABQ5IHH8_9ASTR
MQGVSKTDFENYVKANDAVLRNMQNQGQGLQNQMKNLTEMLSKFITSNTASSSNSGTLPSQTVTNPCEHVNAITTRSGKTCEGPSTPLVPITPVVSIPSKEPKQNPETSMDKVKKPSLESTTQVPPPEEEDSIFMEIPKPKAKKTVNIEIQEPNSPKPTLYQPKLPYPERMKIGLKDALVEMPKFNKWLSGLLRNKKKLEEIAITTVNAECSVIILNKVPEKIEDPGKISLILYEPVLLNTPLTDKVKSFAPEDDIDEIDAFLAMEVPSNFEEGYFDSEGDFAGELMTLLSRIVREHEDYLNHMTLLCEISTSRSQENVHANQSSIIESLPISPIPVEDSKPVQEEIDIFLVPDDLIPPGVENDDSENEDNSILSPEEESFNMDHQDDPLIPRPPPEPPDVEKWLEPETGILITKVFKGVSKPYDFMTDILPTLPTLVSDLTFILFLSSFLSFGSEDTIFDPDIITFPFSYLEPVAFSMEVSCSKCCSP